VSRNRMYNSVARKTERKEAFSKGLLFRAASHCWFMNRGKKGVCSIPWWLAPLIVLSALMLFPSTSRADALQQVNSWMKAGYLVRGGIDLSETDSLALTITVTKKFVKLPEKKQLEILFTTCEQASATLSPIHGTDFVTCYALWPDKVVPFIASVDLIDSGADYDAFTRVEFEPWYLHALRNRDLGR